MGLKQIKPEIDRYLNKITTKIKIDKAILFGSYAKGIAKKDSDVDLIVISKDFVKMDTDERLRILYRLSAGFPYNLHVHGVTPNEFEKASYLTSLGEAKITGIYI